jgi:hypothetical protein
MLCIWFINAGEFVVCTSSYIIGAYVKNREGLLGTLLSKHMCIIYFKILLKETLGALAEVCLLRFPLLEKLLRRNFRA